MDIMAKVINKILQLNNNFVELLFLALIFLTLSFGRIFSIFHINLFSFQIFSNEIVLFLSLPFLIINLKRIIRLPFVLIVTLSLFFLMGCLYLFFGILKGNLFALRDVVLCGYILFLLLSYLIFSIENKIKLFLVALVLANLFALFIGRMFILGINLPFFIRIENVKSTSLGLCYGIAISFLISLFQVVKEKRFRILMLFLISLDLYMSLVFAKRSLWVGYITLSIFFVFILRRAFLKPLLQIILSFVLVSLILFHFDTQLTTNTVKKVSQENILELVLSKVSSVKMFVTNKSLSKEIVKVGVERGIRQQKNILPSDARFLKGYSFSFVENLGNIIWRLEKWRQALDFGLKFPFFGRGFGVYPVYTNYGHPATPPKDFGVNSGVIPTHNHLISIFYKMGLLGLILFLLINSYVFLFAYNYLKFCKSIFLKNILIGSLGAFIFWHSLAFFFDIIDSPPTSIFLWILGGLIFGVVEADKHLTKNKDKP